MLTADSFIEACQSGDVAFLERFLKGTALFELIELNLPDGSSVLMHLILHRDNLDSFPHKYLKAVYESDYYQSFEQKSPLTALHQVTMRQLLDAIERQNQEALEVFFNSTNVEKTCSMVLSDGMTVPMLCALLHLPHLLSLIFTHMTNKKHLSKLLLKKTRDEESFLNFALQSKQQGVIMLLQATLALDSLVLFETTDGIDPSIGIFADVYKSDLALDRLQTSRLASLVGNHLCKDEIYELIRKRLSAYESPSPASPLSLFKLNLLLACEEQKISAVVELMKESDYDFSYFLMSGTNAAASFDPRIHTLTRLLSGRMYFEYDDFIDILLDKLEKSAFKVMVWGFWSKHRHILSEVQLDGPGRLADRLREWNQRWLLGSLSDRSILSRNSILETIIKRRKDLSIFHTSAASGTNDVGIHEGVGFLSCFFTLKFYTGDINFLYTLGEYIEESAYRDNIHDYMVRQSPILSNIASFASRESIHKVCIACGVTEEYISPVAIKVLLYDQSLRLFYEQGDAEIDSSKKTKHRLPLDSKLAYLGQVYLISSSYVHQLDTLVSLGQLIEESVYVSAIKQLFYTAYPILSCIDNFASRSAIYKSYVFQACDQKNFNVLQYVLQRVSSLSLFYLDGKSVGKSGAKVDSRVSCLGELMFMRGATAGFLRHLGILIEECEYADEVRQYIHSEHTSLAHIHNFSHIHYHVDYIHAVKAYTNDNVDDLADVIRRTHRLPIEFDGDGDSDDTSKDLLLYIVEEIMLVDAYKDINVDEILLRSPHLPTIIKMLCEDVWYLESIYKKYMDTTAHPIQHSLVYSLLFTNQELFTFVSQWGNAEFELLRTPIRIINTLTKPLLSHPSNYSKLAALFEAYMRDATHCTATLRYLLFFMYGLQHASAKVVCDSVDLLALQEKLNDMLMTLFQMDSMDDRENVIKLLRSKQGRFDEPLLVVKDGNDLSDVDTEELERLHAMTSNTLCFAEDGLLCFAMEYELKSLFNINQVNNIVEDCYRLNGWTRYCPRTMLYLTLLTKSLTLVCIAYTLTRVYGKEFDADYPMPNSMSATDYKPPWHGVEYYLAIAILADTFYVWGDIVDSGYNLYAYYTYDDWNFLDSVSIILGIVWGLFRLLPDQVSAARVVLAIMAVTWSMGLLRFFTMSRTLGELVITFRMMYKDLKGFLAVYLVTGIGFVIALYGLFTNSNPFDSVSQTILYLFESTLGGFDFTVFPASSSFVNGVGVVAVVCFVIITYVLLFNLLIALMFGTYERVRDSGYMEWSYTKARMIRKLLIVKERHVYRMLPAPLNIIPMVFTFMGRFAYKPCEDASNGNAGRGGEKRLDSRSNSKSSGALNLRSTKRRNSRNKSRRAGSDDTMNVMLVEQLLPNAHFRGSGGSGKSTVDGDFSEDTKDEDKSGGRRLYSIAGRLSDCVINVVLGFPLRCLDASYSTCTYINNACMQKTVLTILVSALLSPFLIIYILAVSAYGSGFVLYCYLSGRSAHVVVREKDGVVVERGVSQSDDKLLSDPLSLLIGPDASAKDLYVPVPKKVSKHRKSSMASMTRVQSSAGSRRERKDSGLEVEKEEPLFCDEDIDRIVSVLNYRIDGLVGATGSAGMDAEEIKRMQRSMEELKNSNDEMKALLLKLLAQAKLNQSG